MSKIKELSKVANRFEEVRAGEPCLISGYHWCRLPETLSHERLLEKSIYFSDNYDDWSSTHLDDMECYELTLDLNNPYVIENATEMYEEIANDEFLESIKSKGHDSLIYIPKKADGRCIRQALVFNAKQSVVGCTKRTPARFYGKHSEDSYYDLVVDIPEGIDTSDSEWTSRFEAQQLARNYAPKHTLRSKARFLEIINTKRPKIRIRYFFSPKEVEEDRVLIEDIVNKALKKIDDQLRMVGGEITKG